MDLGLTGKVALVLGSTAGLGRASAEALAAEGAHVVVAGRRAELVDELAGRSRRRPGWSSTSPTPTRPTTLVSRAVEAFGPVDVVVLNGGGPPPGTADGFTADDAQAAVDLLLTQHVRLVGEVLPGMRERGWGRIVAVGSSGVRQPHPHADRVQRRARRAGGVPQDARRHRRR